MPESDFKAKISIDSTDVKKGLNETERAVKASSKSISGLLGMLGPVGAQVNKIFRLIQDGANSTATGMSKAAAALGAFTFAIYGIGKAWKAYSDLRKQEKQWNEESAKSNEQWNQHLSEIRKKELQNSLNTLLELRKLNDTEDQSIAKKERMITLVNSLGSAYDNLRKQIEDTGNVTGAVDKAIYSATLRLHQERVAENARRLRQNQSEIDTRFAEINKIGFWRRLFPENRQLLEKLSRELEAFHKDRLALVEDKFALGKEGRTIRSGLADDMIEGLDKLGGSTTRLSYYQRLLPEWVKYMNLTFEEIEALLKHFRNLFQEKNPRIKLPEDMLQMTGEQSNVFSRWARNPNMVPSEVFGTSPGKAMQNVQPPPPNSLIIKAERMLEASNKAFADYAREYEQLQGEMQQFKRQQETTNIHGNYSEGPLRKVYEAQKAQAQERIDQINLTAFMKPDWPATPEEGKLQAEYEKLKKTVETSFAKWLEDYGKALETRSANLQGQKGWYDFMAAYQEALNSIDSALAKEVSDATRNLYIQRRKTSADAHMMRLADRLREKGVEYPTMRNLQQENALSYLNTAQALTRNQQGYMQNLQVNLMQALGNKRGAYMQQSLNQAYQLSPDGYLAPGLINKISRNSDREFRLNALTNSLANIGKNNQYIFSTNDLAARGGFASSVKIKDTNNENTLKVQNEILANVRTIVNRMEIY